MSHETISIIGAGLMGHGIAQVFASHGHNVLLYDLRDDLLATARDNIRANLHLMAQHGICPPDAADAALARIRTSTNLEETVADADFILEAVVENMELKQDIFRRLDAMSRPQTVLASNTSVMSITEIASKAARRERIVGTHFWNPPYLIPLVEVVQGGDTSEATVAFTMRLLEAAGKAPIHCRKDVPGFVANRMQHALWREAIHIVEQGIADPATVDKAVRLSFGMRLPALGPMENADMVGLDLTRSIHDYILKDLCNDTRPSKRLDELVNSGKLGFKSGEGLQRWDDERIAASRRHLQEYLLAATAGKPAAN